MNDLDELELKMLADARGFIEPTAADEHRVFSRLSADLVLGDTETSSRFGSVDRGVATRLGQFACSRKAIAMVCSLLGAAAGFGAGYFVGQQRSPAEQAYPSGDTGAVTELQTSGLDGVPAAAPSAPQAAPSDRALAVVPRFARAAEATPHARGTAAKVSPPASGLPPDDPIGEEVALLERVDQAIRSSEPQLALGLIRELDQRFPKGKLLDERAAARVMAQCLQLEPAAARQAGENYLRKAPGRAYHERVRQLCGLVEAVPNARTTAPEKVSGPSGD